jgi:hypothetical protein
MGNGRGLIMLCAVGLVAGACTSSRSEQASASTASRSTSPEVAPSYVFIGGRQANVAPPTVPPEAKPYPYVDPAPPAQPTPLDGTYLRVLTVDQVGGLPAGLPPLCLRCLPFRAALGVSTLIFYRGEAYLNHQLSGFKSMSNFTVSGGEVTLFNSPDCQQKATYGWHLDTGTGELTLHRLSDSCDYADVREEDLTISPWLLVNPCDYRIHGLWPAAIACTTLPGGST